MGSAGTSERLECRFSYRSKAGLNSVPMRGAFQWTANLKVCILKVVCSLLLGQNIERNDKRSMFHLQELKPVCQDYCSKARN
jgi:hypothetical protein